MMPWAVRLRFRRRYIAHWSAAAAWLCIAAAAWGAQARSRLRCLSSADAPSIKRSAIFVQYGLVQLKQQSRNAGLLIAPTIKGFRAFGLMRACWLAPLVTATVPRSSSRRSMRSGATSRRGFQICRHIRACEAQSLTPRQAAAHRDANGIPLELDAVYCRHIRSP